MTDPYKEQYKKETKQIHASAELIARTKAAMREEEARIRQESLAQMAGTKTKDSAWVSGPVEVPAGGRGDVKGFTARRWAYPLTAAAALLILVSVSLTMRGMKSGDMASDDTAYEEPEMEAESAEMSGGEDLDEGMAAAGAAAEVEESAEAVEEAADEAVPAEMDMAAASESVAEEEQVPGLTAGAADDALSEKSESREMKQSEQQRTLNDMEESLVEEETASAAKKAQSGGAADAENITIQKVTKKPDFCAHPDTETRVFKGETFQIAEEENRWAAYVETKDGGKYEIRGEAADVETFLEAGYQKLMND